KHSIQMTDLQLPEALEKIAKGRHSDPFKVLGCHPNGKNIVVRAYLPHAAEAWVGSERIRIMTQLSETGLFEWHGSTEALSLPYQIVWKDKAGTTYSGY